MAVGNSIFPPISATASCVLVSTGTGVGGVPRTGAFAFGATFAFGAALVVTAGTAIPNPSSCWVTAFDTGCSSGKVGTLSAPVTVASRLTPCLLAAVLLCIPPRGCCCWVCLGPRSLTWASSCASAALFSVATAASLASASATSRLPSNKMEYSCSIARFSSASLAS